MQSPPIRRASMVSGLGGSLSLLSGHTAAAKSTGFAAQLPSFPLLGRDILQRGRRTRKGASQDFLQALVSFVGVTLSWHEREGTMAKPPIPNEVAAILKEMQEASPRAAILVGGAMVDHYLTEVLRANLLNPLTAEERLYFPGGRQLLRDFSEKIWMAYFLRLIGPATRRDINLIRELRNEAAHNMNPIRFDQSPISDRCYSLRFSPAALGFADDPPNYRNMFMLSISMLAGLLFVKWIGMTGLPVPEEAIKELKDQLRFLDA